MKKQSLLLSAILAAIVFLEAGCATSNDPNKRQKRALMGGATSTALGLATGVGGPILAARAALGASSRVVTGDVVDSMKDNDKEENAEESEAKLNSQP